MADGVDVATEQKALLDANWGNTVVDLTRDAMPLMGIMFGKYGDKKGFEGIGIPNSGMLLTGVKNALIKKKQILSSNEYKPLMKVAKPPNDGKAMGRIDNKPTRTDLRNNGPMSRVKRPVARPVWISDPCEVPNEDIRMTQRAAQGERDNPTGWSSLGNLLQLERNDVLASHLERWNQLLWGVYEGGEPSQSISTTGAPSDDDGDEDGYWDAPYSLREALRDDNTYCGVDRTLSQNDFWKGNFVSAATAPVFRDMIRSANYSINKPLAKKGQRLDVILCGSDTFPIALAEADAKGGGQIVQAGTPVKEFGQFGFKQDLVKIDNTYIVFDPTCPAGKACGLNLRTLTLAIYPDQNFTQSVPFDNSRPKGGSDTTSWNIDTKLLFVIEAPSLNVWWDNLTV